MKLSPRYDGPPLISIDGPPDDQREAVVRQRTRFAALIAQLSPDDWRVASRCEGWTVQDVVAHLVGVNHFWAASVTAGLSGTPTRILDGFDPAATPPLMVEPMRTLEPAQVLDQFVASNDAFLATIAELDFAEWAVLAESPPGHVPIRLLASHALWDSWVHERDVALPLGSPPAIEADEVCAALRYAAALSPALAVNVGSGTAGTFAVETRDPDLRFTLEVGDSVAVHDSSDTGTAPCLRGDAVELLEALSLRAPLPASAPPEWRALLTGLATAFDSELDGA